jgi:hypothetical protein
MSKLTMRGGVVLLLLTILAGCGSTRGTAIVRELDQSGHRTSRVVPVPELPADQPERPELKLLRDAAVMSAAVYIDVPPQTPLSAADFEKAQLPPLAGWVEDTNLPRTPLPGQRQTPDLTYRLWVNAGTRPQVAMLVFRGTHIRADWYSNLRWFDSWIPGVEDHYEQTQRITPQIIQHIRSAHPGPVTIIAAGHSLGGGLAQTAAYAACGDIISVFAFDSSPVTKHRAANGCPGEHAPKVFFRVFEQSEILSYARFIVRLVLGLRPADPHIEEIKVHLFNGVGVRAHSMQQLAERLNAEWPHQRAAGETTTMSLDVASPPLGR